MWHERVPRMCVALGIAVAIGVSGATPANATGPAGSSVAGQQAHGLLHSPVGGWSGTVVRGDVTDEIELAFEPGGTLCLMTVDGASPGSWRSGPGKGLHWKATEALPGGAGSVKVNQTGTATAGRIQTTGTTTIFDPDGAQVGSVFATVSLKRDRHVTSTCE
jgi:hypothetical protein